MSGGQKRGIRTSMAVTFALLIAPTPLAWAQDTEPQARPRVELSLRSWLFTAGETKWSHDASGLDPRLGNPTSKLTYKDNDTHIIELAGRVNFARRWFVQGDVGFSTSFNRGLTIDDDYTAVGGQQLFSRTHSDVTGSGTQYVNLDVGLRAAEFPGSRGYLDVFGGIQYWRTEYQATGVRQVVCAPSGIPGVSCTPNLNLPGVLAITNTTHWISPHVGVKTEYRFSRRFSVEFKGSLSPVNVVLNDDVHHLRNDLQQNPSFSMIGVGFAGQGEVSVKVALLRNVWLTAGYRGWYNRTYAGTLKAHPIGAPSESVPLKELQTFRHGTTLGLTAAF